MLLDAVLLDRTRFGGVAAVLSPADFFFERHRRTFNRMGELSQEACDLGHGHPSRYRAIMFATFAIVPRRLSRHVRAVLVPPFGT
jgi:hypothetical protein